MFERALNRHLNQHNPFKFYLAKVKSIIEKKKKEKQGKISQFSLNKFIFEEVTGQKYKIIDMMVF